MNKNTEKQKHTAIGPSELRQDPVSGEWVVIATGRAKRPDDFVSGKEKTISPSKDACPFETLFPNAHGVYARDGSGSGTRGQGTTGMGSMLSTTGNIGNGDDWFVQVVPNKYPAFAQGACPVPREIGPYRVIDGIGFHDVVITRDHERSLGAMTNTEAELVLRAYQDRFLAIKQDPCVRYISVFHNHGAGAGATVAHPHSQIIATPAVPPDIGRSIAGSRTYAERHDSVCVHCAVLRHELRAGERVVYQNEDAVVIAPFASKAAFELRVMPRRHEAYFEEISEDERLAVAEALVASLAKISRGLGDPDYNFFLHTAPVGSPEEFSRYHWHIEIIPKTAVWAGFEIGTGIEISTIAPESAAAFLREVTI